MKIINNEVLKNIYISKYKLLENFDLDINDKMILMEFEKGEYLCRENQYLEYLYFFVEGRAKVYVTLKNGKSLLISFYEPLMVLGDLELVNYEKTTTNIQAVEKSYCIAVPLYRFREILLEDSRFLRYTCNTIGDKLKKSSYNSSINLLYPLENRLASYIIATKEMINIKGEKKYIFSEKLTETSELLATSYRHLIRTLNSLINKNVIIKTGEFYEIVNIDKLYEISSDLYK